MDTSITWTNEEATRLKAACVVMGLLEDPHIHIYMQDHRHERDDRIPEPIMLRGTVIRTVTIDTMISALLTSDSQVVNLGCGFDTRSQKCQNATFYEIDFDIVIQRKRIHSSPNARLVECDLNNPGLLIDKLIAAGLDFGKPIVILAECCLMYLQRESVIILFEKFKHLCNAKLDIVTFDALHLNDQFGRRMSINMPVEMPLFESCRSVEDYISIFSGFHEIEHFDILQAESRLSEELKCKLMQKCPLDEVEEWHLIASHYIFCRFSNAL